MASPTHNRSVARTFADQFTRMYAEALPHQKQRMAETLLEQMARTPIDSMEGPTYLIAGFWDELRDRAA